MGVNVIQVLQDAVDSELAAKIAEALAADAIEDAKELKAKDDEIASKAETITALTKSNSEYQAEISRLNSSVSALTLENAALKSDAQSAQQTIATKNAEIDRLNALIAELQAGTPTPAPEPDPEPTPEPEPDVPADNLYKLIPAGYPNNKTTGYPKNITLKPYTGPNPITKAGTVISGVSIKGDLQIKAADVVIEDSLVEGDYWCINGGNSAAKNLTVRRTTVRGKGGPGACIIARGTFTENDLSNSENGIVPKDGTGVIKDNYIHDLNTTGGGHVDGIQFAGSNKNWLVEHNTIFVFHTGAVMIQTSYQNAPIDGTVIRNNALLIQPGKGTYYVINISANFGNPTNTLIENNILQKGTDGGYIITHGIPVTSRGNTDYATGKPVS